MTFVCFSPGKYIGAFFGGGLNLIEYSLKEKCVALSDTMSMRKIYEDVFKPEHSTMSYECFRHRLREWKKKALADDKTLSCGTYPLFTAHAATVQVDGEGRITQAWIKQQQETLDWMKIKDIVCKGAPPSAIAPATINGVTMLEIPLFDMHFGVADFECYRNSLSEIIGIISEKQYDEINIIIGQDVLHNNDMRGHTANGTDIERVDFVKAWEDCWKFFCIIIDIALKHSSRVCLRYSKGNHDECAAWCFFKALEAIYPQCDCDDNIIARKCIYWKGCFIGFGHCEYTKNNYMLFQNFVIDFPKEFSDANVREIHAGHLHSEGQDCGIMVRRLSSAVPTDKWSSDNGFVGSHKRFQVFEWAENRLKAIYYV